MGQHLSLSTAKDDVELGVLNFWNWCVDNSEDALAAKIVQDGVMRYLVYALDLVIKEDTELPKKIDKLFECNPEMVAKCKKNDKLEGWFVGQLVKVDRNLDPKAVAAMIHERLMNK